MMLGVNIIGPIFGEFGIGEDVRSLVQALLSLDIQINIFEYPKKGNFSKASYSFDQYCSNNLVFDINIFCIPIFEVFRFISEYGFSAFEGRYNIGYSPWELEKWPKQYQFMASYLDELWASSHHTFKAYEENLNVPIYLVPLIVELPSFNENLTASISLNIDQSKFNFLYVFDSNSTFARKNPHDAISAFQKAFWGHPEVVLVLKTMGYRQDNDELNRSLKDYSNIVLINDCLSRSELFSLYKACDAYVSLHKAEGFGRTIAEAMLLKKPVITSNYSGNVDFCIEKTAFLVQGDVKAIAPYAYPFWFENRWFFPDIESAKTQMLRCFNDSTLRSNITENAYQLISNTFSSQTISKLISRRLDDVFAKIKSH